MLRILTVQLGGQRHVTIGVVPASIANVKLLDLAQAAFSGNAGTDVPTKNTNTHWKTVHVHYMIMQNLFRVSKNLLA